ncbi:MAG: hydrogenase nickel incorporation protein HypB [Anaerolineaceae bacterium]
MTDAFKVIEIKQSVYENNNQQAAEIRETLKKSGTFLLNLMSSPGSGKTTTVVKTIAALKDEMKIGVVEADVDSDVDARTVSQTGARVIQLHTGGMCHMDAYMTRQGLSELGTEGLDFVILENIGNLLCPAEVDTGAVKNAMILSVPEGDDKPLKYPLMFSVVDVLLVNKIDAMPFFDFDMQALSERVARLNPKVRIIPISAKTGQGMSKWADWIRCEVKEWKNTKSLIDCEGSPWQ